MPQLRLTAKMAKELKITQLQNPDNCTKLYDDWYVDVTRILRKKVFVFMHVHSKIALAVPSYEIGGIHGLFECFALLLREFLNSLDYDEIAEQAYDYFCCPKSQINFVKTNDKSTLRYISTFKFSLEYEANKYQIIDQELCDETSQWWKNHFLQDKSRVNAYTTPLKLLESLLTK